MLAHVFERRFPALLELDPEALVHQLDLGAEDAAHQDVADAVIDAVVPVDPALLHQPALHAELGGDGRDLAGVVGLHATDGDQRVAVLRDRFRHQVFELAHLVAAEGEAGVAVLALGPDLDAPAEMVAEALQFLDRCRSEGQLEAWKLVEPHGWGYPLIEPEKASQGRGLLQRRCWRAGRTKSSPISMECDSIAPIVESTRKNCV